MDVWEDVSVGGGGWVDVWMDVSVGGWWLGGCVGRWVAVGWMFGWMCR